MTTGLLDPHVDALIDMGQPISLLHPLRRGLVSCWMALPGTMGSSRFMDIISPGPNGNHGTLTNMVPSFDWQAGGPGDWGSLFFASTADQRIVVPSHASLDLQTNAFTMIVRLKPSDTTDGNIMGKWDTAGNQRAYLFAAETTKYLCAVSADGSFLAANQKVGNTSMVAGLWQTTGVTWDAGDMAFYFEGKPDGTDTTTATTLFASSAAFNIADLVSGGALFSFAGNISNAWLYNRALTPLEMALHKSLGLYGYPGLLRRIGNGSAIGAAGPVPVNGVGLPPYGQVIFNSADEENRPRYGQRIARGTEE